jgi:5-enolpyruvylshikimate-3-phosphate synthase
MLAAIAEGSSHIDGFLEGEDTRATARILQQLGVRIEAPSPGGRIVHGVGLHGLRASSEALDCGNAGTGMRLLAGLLAGQAFASTLTGDASLSARPMARVMRPLAAMGARISAREGGLPPLESTLATICKALISQMKLRAHKVKSAVLLAACTQAEKRSFASRKPRAITPSACSPRSAGRCASRAMRFASRADIGCGQQTSKCRPIFPRRPFRWWRQPWFPVPT